MKLWCLILISTCCLLGQSSVTLFRKTSPSIYLLETDSGAGTGFCVSSNGLVATSLHVVDGAKTIAALQNGSKIIDSQVDVASRDEAHDLAVLQLSTHRCQPLKLETGRGLQPGQRIFVIGNPLGRRELTASISDGLISGIRTLDSHGEVIQISAPLSHGNSGGPVLDDGGSVVGIVAFKLSKGELLNFAIPASNLRTLLASQSQASTRQPKLLAPPAESSADELPEEVNRIFTESAKASGTCRMTDASWTSRVCARTGLCSSDKFWQRSDFREAHRYESHDGSGSPLIVLSGKNENGSWVQVGDRIERKPLSPEDIVSHLVDDWYAYCPGTASLWKDLKVYSDELAGEPTYRIAAKEPFYGASVTFWFRKKDYMLVAREYMNRSASGPVILRDNFLDFRRVGDVVVAFARYYAKDGKQTGFEFLDSFQPNVGLPDYIFEPKP